MNKKLIWTIVFLIGAYTVAQAVADVAATKFVQMWGIALPAGSIMFALTFTLRDLVHKRLGRDWARAAIVFAAIANIVQAIYLQWMANMPAPPFVDPEYTLAWSNIFALVPSITIASIIAEVVSELCDTEVYHFWLHKMIDERGWPQWTAVVASNVVALPIDSFIFATLAFTLLPLLLGGESLPIGAALTLVVGQIAWKAAVTAVSLPTIYLVKRKPISAASELKALA